MGFGRRIIAAIALFLALSVASPPALAQVPDPFARQLAHQLATAETDIGQHGYARIAGPFAGGLAANDGGAFQLTLRAGQEYRIIGVCDARCRDLGMPVYDPSGALVGDSMLSNGMRVIDLRPSQTGSYTVDVQMRNCAAAACYFAFNVYAR